MNTLIILGIIIGCLKGYRDWNIKKKHFIRTANNKYKKPLTPTNHISNPLYRWYHKLNNLPHKEAFPFSATFLVFITDGFHFSSFLIRLSIASAIFIHYDIKLALIYWAAHMVGFNIVYKIILR